MNRKALFVIVTALFASMLSDATAEAQSRRRGHASYATRHTTMPKQTLRLDIAPYEAGLNDAGIILGPYNLSAYGLRFIDWEDDGEDDVDVMLGMGLSYGIFDSLEIGLLAAPLNFDQGQVYGDLTPYVRWAFLDDDVFQIGLNGAVQIPTWSDLGFSIGLPININAGRIVRIESGAKVELLFDDDNDMDGEDELRLAIDVPIALTVNIRPRGFLGFRSDLLFDQLGGDDGDSAFRPGIGAHGGFTLFGRHTSYADFKGSFMGYFKDNIIDWEIVLGASVAFGL